MLRTIFLVLFLITSGCSFAYVSFDKLADDPVKLKEQIVVLESKVVVFEQSLKEEKNSRDLVAKAAENAEGYFSKDSAMTKLALANGKLRLASDILDRYKMRLAEAQAKMQTLEQRRKNTIFKRCSGNLFL